MQWSVGVWREVEYTGDQRRGSDVRVWEVVVCSGVQWREWGEGLR